MSYKISDRDKEFSDALRPAVEKMIMNDEKILHEILQGYFPNLNTKESIVCEGITATVFDNDYRYRYR